ncbi:hypothetical protein PC112_g8594 [Phytophthora cactorum]|nr:hypothetical protein PC112_g8594 [Phytophthora cactorum]
MSINSAYVAKYKPDPAGAITVEFSGDKRRAMLGLVRSVLEPVELLETTLRSAGKNANGLSAWAVRYYRHLARICSVYMRLCVQELRARIQSMVSGEYCLVLLPVSDAAEVEFGAASDDAALASLLSKTVEQLTYLDGVCEVHKRLRYSAPGARESSRACGSTESAQGDEGHVHDGGLMYPVELANLKDKNRVAEEERKSRIWWRSSA